MVEGDGWRVKLVMENSMMYVNKWCAVLGALTAVLEFEPIKNSSLSLCMALIEKTVAATWTSCTSYLRRALLAYVVSEQNSFSLFFNRTKIFEVEVWCCCQNFECLLMFWLTPVWNKKEKAEKTCCCCRRSGTFAFSKSSCTVSCSPYSTIRILLVTDELIMVQLQLESVSMVQGSGFRVQGSGFRVQGCWQLSVVSWHVDANTNVQTFIFIP